MSFVTLLDRFLLRGANAADLAVLNEVPLRNEVEYEADTGKFKVGDDATNYNTLLYVGGQGATAGNTLAALKARQAFVLYNGTTPAAGQFDGSASAPTNSTRLNYDGYFYATRMFADRFTGAHYGDGANLTGISAAGISQYDLPQVFTLALARGNVGYWSQIAGTTTNSFIGLNVAASPAGTGSFAAGAIASTNAITQSSRDEMTSAAGAGSSAWRQIGVAILCVRGGFVFGMRCAVLDAATVANSRMFMGFRAVQTAPGNVEPDTLVDCILLGAKAGDANLSVFWNDNAGTCSSVNLGAGFPAQSLSADIYKFEVYCAPGAASATYRVTRFELATGTTTPVTGSMSGNLPTSTTLLSPQWWRNNGATALAVKMANMNVYCAWNLEG